MSATIETTGKLHGLMRKVGKIGGEHIVFSVTITDLEEWNRLIQFAEQPVAVTITAPQAELPLDGDKKPIAETGAFQAQD